MTERTETGAEIETRSYAKTGTQRKATERKGKRRQRTTNGHVGVHRSRLTYAKASTKDVFFNQERKLGDRMHTREKETKRKRKREIKKDKEE